MAILKKDKKTLLKEVKDILTHYGSDYNLHISLRGNCYGFSGKQIELLYRYARKLEVLRVLDFYTGEFESTDPAEEERLIGECTDWLYHFEQSDNNCSKPVRKGSPYYWKDLTGIPVYKAEEAANG
ncbi:hypothetical protein SAMN02910357_00062 [Succinivibrio dextrinosolvens]|uniref:hypothetical protein n=1 Tax=Succinivibrio dextrinosolvens TaxID=83771 RepID=UPI0008E11717|nr:hypothetical protein [Succinivibrio dextrinosolvens]SFS31747.1 hypothetical protein SAMN02910357_00062 [Succinivibrio dextrinosolvens]